MSSASLVQSILSQHTSQVTLYCYLGKSYNYIQYSSFIFLFIPPGENSKRFYSCRCVLHASSTMQSFVIITLMISDKECKLWSRPVSWNMTYCHSSTDRCRPIISIMDRGNTIPIHHVDTVVLKCTIVISFGNLSLYPITDQRVSKALKWINPTKSLGLDGMQHFIFNSCLYTSYIY